MAGMLQTNGIPGFVIKDRGYENFATLFVGKIVFLLAEIPELGKKNNKDIRFKRENNDSRLTGSFCGDQDTAVLKLFTPRSGK